MMRNKRDLEQSARRCFTIVVLLAFLFVGMAFGQFDSGQISGFVRDSAGLIIPGVSVTAINEGNRQERSVVSNEEGYYVFPTLMVGTYTVKGELSGFKRFAKSGINLSAAAKISVDVVLQLGDISETVEVVADPAAVQTDTAVLGRTVALRELQEMPLSGRNPVRLAHLKAGVIGGTISSFAGGNIGTGINSINGGRANDVLVTVDGAIGNRTRSTDNTMLGAQNVETVQEIQILTSNYQAEYGRASSGIVRLVTKSGGQDYHGTLTEVFQNSALNANTWSRNASGNPRLAKAAPVRYNQFGFSLGGPIYIPGKFNSDKTKLFFFWGEEWIRHRFESTITRTVPSLAMRQGDLSELLDPANPFFRRTRVATDPLTGEPFPDNIIPTERLSPQGQALLAGSYPEPIPGFREGTSNYIGTFPRWTNQHSDTLKVDYVINDRHSLAFRGTHIPRHFNSVRSTGRYEELWSRPNRTAAFTFHSTWSTFFNELTLSANSDGLGAADSDPGCGPRCQRSTYGISYPYLFPGEKKFDAEKLPTLRVTGLSTQDNGPYPGYWAGFVYALSNNMTKIMGSHTLKWGIFIERSGQNDQIQFTSASAPATNNENGAFRFFDSGHPEATGLAIANVLLGNFNDYSEFAAKPMTPFVATAWDWFLQDSWKATPNLNIEAGVRFSIWPAWYSKWNTLAMFHPDYYDPAQAAVVDPSGGFIVSGDRFNGIVMPGDDLLESARSRFPYLDDFTHMYHGLPRGFADATKGIQPRLGFAYALNPKTVVRVGVGKFLNRIAINRDMALGGNPPFMNQVTVINGSVDAPGGAERLDFPFTVTMQDPVLPAPTAWSGNATVQRRLPSDMSLEVAYVGRRGYYNQRKRNINQLLPGTVQANRGINVNALRPYHGLGIIGLSENTGRSWYHSMQVTVERPVATGLRFGVAYTLSRNKDNGSGERQLLPNAYNDKDFYGISDLDRTHRVMAHYIYNLPSPTDSTLARWLLGGWAITGINQFQSGSPFTVTHGSDNAGVGAGSGSQFWNQVGDPTDVQRTDFTTSAVWFNGDAFERPAPGTWGSQPRNALKHPGYWDWNLSVRRTFRVTESQSLDFRWEAFNVLNHPRLSSANSNPTSGSFGLVTSKTGNRTMQIVLQYRF